MTCCAEEQALQRSACPAPGDAPAAVFASPSKIDSFAAFAAPARAVSLAEGIGRSPAARPSRLGLPPEGPPLYRLHAQLLI